MKKVNNIINMLFGFGLLVQIGLAQAPAWDSNGDGVLDNFNDYENNGSVTAKVYPDGAEGGALGDMIAAFVGDEQRGVGVASEVPVFLGNGYAFLMMVYSNATGGESMTFKYYDSVNDNVYDCDESLDFTVNMVEGDVTSPFALNFTTSTDDGGSVGGGDFVSSGLPAWDANGDGVLDNFNDYENNGSVTAKVYADGTEVGDLGDMVAAFVDGEQRGVGVASEVPVFLGNGYAFLMMVYSNATGGETMTFQYYDSAEDAVYNTSETLDFTVNMVEGDVTNPFALNYTPGSGDGGGGTGDSGDFVSFGPVDWDLDGDGVLDNFNDYENNGSVTAKVYADGVEGGALGDLIAAFVDGEQRGVGAASEVPVFLGNGYAFLMMVYSNATGGETMTFQYYDESSNSVYNTNETLDFTVNMVEGDVTNPFALTFSMGDAPSDVPGCTDSDACNYNSSATSDDGSCSYPEQNFDCDDNCLVDTDCAGVCGGSSVVDECGECGGDGIDEGFCDCEGNVDLGCGCGEPAAEENFDCDGNCLVDTDCAGVCGGSTTIDCNGVCGGSAIVDNCDTCVGGDTGLEPCELDCEGVYGGSAVVDECGVCSGGTTDHVANSDQDCAGVCFGDAVVDDCGVCSGGTTGHVANSDQDCAGVCFGEAVVDDCDVCSGGTTGHVANSDQDCAGVCFGEAVVDDCDVCSGGTTDHVANSDQDCAGECFGDATEDLCGVCNDDVTDDNASCTGCTDPGASNFDPFATIPGTCEYDAFSFNQSMSQAFYFFTECTINGEPCVEGEDGIYAFTTDGICTGGGEWGGSTIEIPVMGSDATTYTSGCSIQAYTNEDECEANGGTWGSYLDNGDIPNFRIVDGSTGAVYDAVMNQVQGAFGDCSGYPGSVCETFPAFSYNEVYWALGSVDAVADCNGQVGGHAYTDDCLDCSGGSTGLGHNHNDTDDDTICNEGAANGDADNCPDTPNTDQWNYDGDTEGDVCDEDDDNDGALDEVDTDDNNEFVCSDDDQDTCDDCSTGSYNTLDDGFDYDTDGLCDAGDPDDDNDKALDEYDTDDNKDFV